MTLALLNSPVIAIVLLLTAGLCFSIVVTHVQVHFIRQFTLTVSLISLALGLLGCYSFDKSNLGFQFIAQVNFIPEYNLALTLGVDGLSMVFLLLTLFIFPILFLASWSVEKQPKHFLNYLLAMELLLVLTFTTTDLFYFYVFFESLLIPMFILIGVWGARERKIKAAYYFFLYTLFGSLFMLFGVLYLYTLVGSTSYFNILNTVLDPEQQRIIWLCFFLAFAVKMPLFPLHIWLPEAHVEAPTVGSMLLASLLLKLGGYGFLRFSLTLLAEGSAAYAPLVSACALLGVVYGSLSTLRQIDLKRIIAYSSVAHMNLVVLGIFSNNQQGLEGAIYLMLGHGVVSTALFFSVGVLYDRHHSRLLRYYGGVAAVMPLFATFFFAFTLANMSFPATSNFLGELLIFVGIFGQNSTILLFSTAGIVLSAAYSVWLYNRVAFGSLKTQYISEFTDLNARETFVFLPLLISMLVLGLYATFLIEFYHLSVKTILISEAVVGMLFCTGSNRAWVATELKVKKGTLFPKTHFRSFSTEGQESAKKEEKVYGKTVHELLVLAAKSASLRIALGICVFSTTCLSILLSAPYALNRTGTAIKSLLDLYVAIKLPKSEKNEKLLAELQKLFSEIEIEQPALPSIVFYEHANLLRLFVFSSIALAASSYYIYRTLTGLNSALKGRDGRPAAALKLAPPGTDKAGIIVAAVSSAAVYAAGEICSAVITSRENTTQHAHEREMQDDKHKKDLELQKNEHDFQRSQSDSSPQHTPGEYAEMTKVAEYNASGSSINSSSSSSSTTSSAMSSQQVTPGEEAVYVAFGVGEFAPTLTLTYSLLQFALFVVFFLLALYNLYNSFCTHYPHYFHKK